MTIYVLLPVYNRLASTRIFLESLLAQSCGDFHLILIDDGSTDGTQDYVKGKIKDLTVLTGQGHWWWGGSLHQGYKWLKENKVSAQDLVLIINNDTEFGSDFIKTGAGFLASRQRTLLLARVYGKQSGNFIEAGIHANWRQLTFENTDQPDQINCLSTRGLFLRVEDLMGIGGFHPVLLPHYLSDYEFTMRAHGKGFKLMTDPSLKLFVNEDTTGFHARSRKVGRGVFLKDYFSVRSSGNPLYWFSFVALACPWGLKPLNFLRVIYGGLVTVFRKIVGIYNNKWQ